MPAFNNQLKIIIILGTICMKNHAERFLFVLVLDTPTEIQIHK